MLGTITTKLRPCPTVSESPSLPPITRKAWRVGVHAQIDITLTQQNNACSFEEDQSLRSWMYRIKHCLYYRCRSISCFSSVSPKRLFITLYRLHCVVLVYEAESHHIGLPTVSWVELIVVVKFVRFIFTTFPHRIIWIHEDYTYVYVYLLRVGMLLLHTFCQEFNLSLSLSEIICR